MRIPAGVAALKEELIALGYSVVSEQGSDWPGAEIVLRPGERRAPQVRLSHDRGVWGVEALVDGHWRSTYEAFLALRGEPHQERALSHDERRRATLDFLAAFDGSREHVRTIKR